MKILFIGDIMGRPGREAIKYLLPQIKKEEAIDLVIANGENIAGGFGITSKVAYEMFDNGVNAITLGNHCWDRKEVKEIINHSSIIRPANYPEGVEGKGYIEKEVNNLKVGIMNLMGRVFMSYLDCPFRVASQILKDKDPSTKIVIVDFHAEITSEKVALGWYLDGKVSAVIGTHTHVQTADERVLPQGTAYITDVGMTGAQDSVIGMDKEIIIKKYLTQIPIRFEVAHQNPVLCGVIIEIDEESGKAKSIKRIAMKYYASNNS